MKPRLSHVDWQFTRLVELAESVLISIVSVFLVILVVVALIAVTIEVRDALLHQHNFTQAVLLGVDGTFLAVILLELLHTTLSRGPISQQVQEFLVIGVTAGVRHGLELAAGGRQGNPRDVVISLAINAVAVLVLAAALWLIRGPSVTRERPEQLRD